MKRTVPFAAALALAACAAADPITPAEFTPHGRFAAANKEQAYLDCKLRAESAGRQTYASGAPGALPTVYGPPPLVVRAVYDTMRDCMQAKGYAWAKAR